MRIVLTDHSRQHGDAICASGEDIGDAVYRDAADADYGLVDGDADLGESLQAEHRSGAVALGGGAEDGSDAEIVDWLFGDLDGLFDGVGGAADDRAGSEDPAGHVGWQIGSAEVDGGGADGSGDIDAVVDQHRGIVLSAGDAHQYR